MALGFFPFGEPVLPVRQADHQSKKVFVLGVYASAVHARWRDEDGRQLVAALAVASEPCIFWTGSDAARIIGRIKVPSGMGALEPADGQLNGPSGVALDQGILGPLGLGRADAWLCDLVPHSCVNIGQRAAIKRAYLPLAGRIGLPAPSVPELPEVLADSRRQDEIAEELLKSEAEVLILLGDKPIKWFLHRYDKRTRLSQFGETTTGYGRLHAVEIEGRAFQVLPLAHPRQIAKLGASSAKWHRLHKDWARKTAATLLRHG